MGMCPLAMPKEIEWSVSSKIDLRWNKKGISTVAMMFDKPPEALSWIKRCEKKFGKRPKGLLYEADRV